MIDNRHTIDDTDLVRPEQLLDQGIPLPLLSGKYEVREGYCAVVTEGGVFKEILTPGFYHLHRYKMFRNIRAVLVDMRVKQLSIETSRKYQIKYPVPVQLDLDLVVEYKVTDVRRVALEIDQPLHALFDRINMAINPVLSVATYDEVNLRREEFGERIFQGLKGMQLPKTIGIDVLSVIITTLKALDAGNDVLSQQTLDEFKTIREWQVDSTLLQNSQMDIRTILMQASPDERMKFLAVLADKGYMDPAGSFLGQPQRYNSTDPAQMLNELLSGFGNSHNSQNLLGGMPSGFNQLNAPQQTAPGKSSQGRIVEEVNLLKNIPGAKTEIKPGVDQYGVHDGSYMFMVEVPKISGGKITCYFSCGAQYPDVPPLFALEVNGEDYLFDSSNIRSWRRQYLIEIVNEVLAGVG